MNSILRSVQELGESEIPAESVGEFVMQQLQGLDGVAYVRFASVYREFKDVRDFVEELEPILAESHRSQQTARSSHSEGVDVPSGLT